jgi:hypothetical protein
MGTLLSSASDRLSEVKARIAELRGRGGLSWTRSSSYDRKSSSSARLGTLPAAVAAAHLKSYRRTRRLRRCGVLSAVRSAKAMYRRC